MNDFEQAKKELREIGIKKHITINNKSTEGWTCLHAGCQYGNLELVTFFINDLKADPNILSDDGWGALHIASHLGFYEIVDVLLKHPSTKHDLIGTPEKCTALHSAVNAGHFKVVQMFLMNNVDFSTKNADGKTPKDVCDDQNILSLFERFEKVISEGKSNTVKLDSPREEIKEEPELEDNEESKGDIPKTQEVTIKFDVDDHKQGSKASQDEENKHDNDTKE